MVYYPSTGDRSHRKTTVVNNKHYRPIVKAVNGIVNDAIHGIDVASIVGYFYQDHNTMMLSTTDNKNNSISLYKAPDYGKTTLNNIVRYCKPTMSVSSSTKSSVNKQHTYIHTVANNGNLTLDKVVVNRAFAVEDVQVDCGLLPSPQSYLDCT